MKLRKSIEILLRLYPEVSGGRNPSG